MGGAQTHVELLRFLYARRATGDLQPLLNVLSDDVDWCSVGAPGSLPWSGRWSGKRGVLAFFDLVASEIDVLDCQLMDHMEDDDQIAWFCRMTYKAHGSARIETVDKVDLITFRGDRIVKFWEMFRLEPVMSYLAEARKLQ